MTAKLIITMDGRSREIPLIRERLAIGRATHNDVVIDHPAVSAEHAVIVIDGNDAYLQDLGSTNGTTVNGQPVMRHFLQDGDVIELAECTIRYGETSMVEQCGGGVGKPVHPQIRILNGANAGKIHTLSKSVTTIGRYAGEVAAIAHGENGLALLHIEGKVSPLLNGDPIMEEICKLQHEDIVEIAGARLQVLYAERSS